MLADIRRGFGHGGPCLLDRERKRRFVAAAREATQRLRIARKRRQRPAATHRRAIVRNPGGVEGRVGFRRDALARAPGDEDRFRGITCDRDDFVRNLLGKFTLQRGIDHRHAVDVRIVDDDLERAVDEARVVENGRSDIDRVEQRAEARHELTQLRRGFRRKRRHLHAAADALVGHEDSGAPGNGDDGESIALGQLPAAEPAAIIDDVLNVLHLDDARLPEGGLVERHRAAQVRRVRGRGLLSLVRVAHLPHENGFPGGHRPLAHLDQAPCVLQPLDVAHDHLGLGLANVVVDDIQRRHADLVAGRHHLPERQPPLQRGEIHHRKTESAALRDHAHRARGVMRVEDRTEPRVDVVGNVDHALAVGPDDADVELLRDRHELALKGHALSAHFGESRAEYDHVRHALLSALAQHLGNARRVHQDQDQVGRLGHLGKRRVAAQPCDLLVARIDRIELALIAMRLEKPERLAADGIEILGGADDGNGARIEKALEVGSHS